MSNWLTTDGTDDADGELGEREIRGLCVIRGWFFVFAVGGVLGGWSYVRQIVRLLARNCWLVKWLGIVVRKGSHKSSDIIRAF